jgi:hypothetical protein
MYFLFADRAWPALREDHQFGRPTFFDKLGIGAQELHYFAEV